MIHEQLSLEEGTLAEGRQLFIDNRGVEFFCNRGVEFFFFLYTMIGYGVAASSRLLKMIGLCCERDL